MYKTQTSQPSSFKKKLLATAITSIAVLGASEVVMAQSSDGTVEEVVVTGIRGSLQQSMDIKRNSQGVVDAISAEDIGKMPDSNLAESLQRITGVSIDRANNEGSKVTVRGFGPEFNLVTLNGRQMPTAGLNNFDRSFDLNNLASEGVSGLEVHKTFKASQPSGGIGSVINIKTARPLDNPGLKASVGVKGDVDTTNVTGSDVTPEISGIFSDTFADDKFGIAIFGSHQVRDSRKVEADIDHWTNDIEAADGIPASATIVDNRTDKTGHTYYPRNFGYGIEDISRTRDNGQLVLQYAPVESVKATLDYTYLKLENEGLRDGVGIWFSDTGGDLVSAVIDKNGTYRKVTERDHDFAANQRLNTSQNEEKSLGFNLEWDVTDNLTLTFDAHNSTAESKGTGLGNDVFLILAATNIDQKTMDSLAGNDIPDMLVTYKDGSPGEVNGEPTGGSYDSLFAQAGLNDNKSTVDQYQLHGVWRNSSDGGIESIDFGAASTKTENRRRSWNTGQLAAGWYGGNFDLFPDDMFVAHKLNGLMPSFSGGNSSPNLYHTWDWDQGLAIMNEQSALPAAQQRQWGWGNKPVAADVTQDPVYDDTITEDTTSLYIQFNGKSEFAGMPLTFVPGLRYESTDVTASSFQKDPKEIVWKSYSEWGTNLQDDSSYTHVNSDYNVWLPSLDTSLGINDDLIARFSYSKSLTRADLMSLRGNFSVTDRPKENARTGEAGNPSLKPFTSDNFDLSVEWYYGDASYVSAGFFMKQVDNFIVREFVKQTAYNLRDPKNGPRAEQALADLAAANIDATDQNLFDRINANAGQPVGSAITQTNDDPLAEFEISTPKNLETANMFGWEFGIQHMFGESGFGLMANATFVDGDLKVDNSRTDFQFVLPGLSDSANLGVFFDKYGLQARIMYNWRDEFLNGVGEGNTPYYTEAYGQVDMQVSYELPWVEGLTVEFQGLNVNEASQRVYARYKDQFKHAEQYGARYSLGVRYTF